MFSARLFIKMILIDNIYSACVYTTQSMGYGNENMKLAGTEASSIVFAIQIKICAEYRDMLPRPRLVCQEPGLRPIGRSPGVPDKSSRGLGSMSRYSAQILICFIAYIFSIFNFSVGLVGNLAELPPCTVPPATVHCYQNEAAQCSSDNQISQHALLRGSRKKHSLAFMPQNW